MQGCRVLKVLLPVLAAACLAGCATQPTARVGKLAGRVWDPKLGVWSSPQMVADGDPVPRGGGSYLTGRPYVIGGHTYVPSQNATGYVAMGTASWYGDAFHGRRTANGEVFDKGSISAAHPTLPLPSYVRVTNMGNGRSMIVRVNDRGPYHGGRVMDVSQRVAEALSFRGAGTARIKVEYIGKAPLSGSDDDVLLASLRTDGSPAHLDGTPDMPATMVADAAEPAPPAPAQPSPSVPAAALRATDPDPVTDEVGLAPTFAHVGAVPVPPTRPFNLDEPDPAGPVPRRTRRHVADAPAAIVLPPVAPRPSALLRHTASSMVRRQAWLGPDRAGRD